MRKSASVLLFSLLALVFSQCGPDTEPPSIRLVHPRDGDTLFKGPVTIKVHAEDGKKVERVEFRLEDSLLGSDFTARSDTFEQVWDASGVENMSRHEIRVRAFDAAGNSNQRKALVVVVGSGPTIHSGPVIQSETWTRLGSPHVVRDSVVISHSAVLTIEPGCRVLFDSAARLASSDLQAGSIVAQGNDTARIVFTSNRADPEPGDWAGVSLRSRSSGGTFAYCTLEFGGGGQGLLVNRALGTKMHHCVVRRSGSYGVDCADGAFEEFDHNQVTECDSFPLRVGCEYLRTIHPANDFVGNSRNAIEIEGGFVVTSATWPSFTWVPYYISSSVSVGDNANTPILAIAPGATLRFAPGSELAVGLDAGALVADGTSGHILFTSAAASPAPGDWCGIAFYGNSLDRYCRLRYCRIEYGGNTNMANVLAQNAVPEVRDDSVGHSSGFGVRLDGIEAPNPDTLLEYNRFYDCRLGYVGR